ncbi:MAG: complex I subunit 1 family protein [Gemmatimonadota bacterium]
MIAPLSNALILMATLVAGVYLVAVTDRLVAERVAGRRIALGPVLSAPLRRAAFLVVQQVSRTERPDAEAWALAPALLGGVAALGLASIPLAPGLAVADVPEGIVLFGAAMALVMVAVFLHGWSANSMFPLIGGYRFVAVALSYEMPLALVLIAAALPAESLSVGEIVRSQTTVWNVIRQPLGLPIYLVAASGLAFWGPLRLPDATDLSGGTRAEVSGAALLVWEIGRAMVLVAAAAMGAAVFLGGWLGPWIPGPVWMGLKTVALLGLIIWTGHRVAQFRIERFVVVAWAVLIPLALIDVFASGWFALAGR